jgi:hypothetical protein
MKKFLMLSCFALCLIAQPANAHRITTREIHASGRHWCAWSIASTCTRFRAAGNRSYGLGCTGPNDMRSGCVAQRRGLR